MTLKAGIEALRWQAQAIEQELKRSGQIKTPVVYFNDPESDLDEYRLPDWVASALGVIELGRPGGHRQRARGHTGVD